VKQKKLKQRGSKPLSKRALEYHKKQFETPYQSTVAFCDWLETLGCLNKETSKAVIDIGSGMGANLFFMERRFPHTAFTGIEKNPLLVSKGKAYLKKMGASRCTLVEGDIFALPKTYKGKYEGLTSYQTLSWFPEFKTPLKKMLDLKPNWIALTSLFFDGRVDAQTIIRDYTSPQIGSSASNAAKAGYGKPYSENFYNTYSIPLVREFLATNGYKNFFSTPFEIGINLQKPKDGMGTYTKLLASGRRLQISGPMLMNWHFIVAKRSNNE